MNRWSLTQKTAVVTGGTEGIGLACVEELLALGASVVLVARTESKVTDRVAELTAKYPESGVHGVVADCAKAAQRQLIVDVVSKYFSGKLDILVNNVGTNVRKPTLDFDEADYARVVDLNFKSVYELSRELHPLLKAAGKSSIVNIGSVAGLTVVKSGSLYAASKAALSHMTRYNAVEWALDGIRVNLVAPWYTRTPLAQQVMQNEDYLAAILDRTPIGRIAEPDEVSGMVAFLCMEGPAGYITGQVISTDGGMTAYGFAYNP